MKQATLATSGFEKHRKQTRKAEFLSRMDKLVPWAKFCTVIGPYYPKAGNGRPPIGLERMLRMYFIAHWFNLADEACGDALYDIAAFRDFCRIDSGREGVPDASSLLNFRHLLEEHKLGSALFAKVGEPQYRRGGKRIRPFVNSAKARNRGCSRPLQRVVAGPSPFGTSGGSGRASGPMSLCPGRGQAGRALWEHSSGEHGTAGGRKARAKGICRDAG